MGALFFGGLQAQAATHTKPKAYTRSELRKVVYSTHSDLVVSAKDKRLIKRVLFNQKRTVSKRLGRKYLYRVKREVVYYKTHLLPWCTWGPESGAYLPAFHPARYTAMNSSSTAAGKYQFLDSTWLGLGGKIYGSSYHIAAYAPPLVQEKMAHYYVSISGLSPWVNC